MVISVDSGVNSKVVVVVFSVVVVVVVMVVVVVLADVGGAVGTVGTSSII